MNPRTVITVGNFDGVHRGHQAMLRRARDLADRLGAEVVAVTFSQHPMTLLRPKSIQPMLMQRRQSIDLLSDGWADRVEVLPLAVELLKLAPEQFVDQMIERFNPAGWVEGVNFRFGRHRKGDVNTLREIGERRGFQVDTVDLQTVTLRDKTQAEVSSSLVRWLVYHGRMPDAALCLGRPFTLRGRVSHGEERGRMIGVPTANLDCGDQALPGAGVYAGQCTVDGQTHTAAISVGVKPTFHGHQVTCEVHLLDFDGDLYDRTLEVRVIRWMRDQQAFAGIDILAVRLQRDLRAIRQYDEHGLLDPNQTILHGSKAV